MSYDVNLKPVLCYNKCIDAVVFMDEKGWSNLGTA